MKYNSKKHKDRRPTPKEVKQMKSATSMKIDALEAAVIHEMLSYAVKQDEVQKISEKGFVNWVNLSENIKHRIAITFDYNKKG